MKVQLREYIKQQLFFPNWLGPFINPFYLARRGLANTMQGYSKFLSGKLLDVGCGSKPYRSLFYVDEYIGLDIDSEMARTRGVADKFYDGHIFPFQDNEFDAILCNQVLEHVFNPDEFLSEIYRVMKPGGKMVLTVPFVWDEHEQPYDYARYSSFGLRALCEKNGFKVIEHEKICADASLLFQLANAYLYKITVHWRKYWRVLIIIFVMGPINLMGLLAGVVFPKNPDLFLDQVVLVGKMQ